jgi:hypothetical protein
VTITENLEALLRKIAVCAKVNDEGGGSKAHRQVVAMFRAAWGAPANPAAPAPAMTLTVAQVLEVVDRHFGIYPPDDDMRVKFQAALFRKARGLDA